MKATAAVDEAMRTYWSSRGSGDPASGERLEYALAHPVCVVRSVALRAFQASWQEGHPIYAPRSVRFHFGFGPDSVHAVFTVDHVQRTSALLRWTLPGPVVASWIGIDLLGRTQTQPSDNLYYTCLSYVGG